MNGADVELASAPKLPPGELGGKLAGMSLPRQVFALAIWPFLEQMLNFLVTFTDMALAGRLSEQAAAAITVGAYFAWLIGIVQMSMGVGAAAVIARAVGARHRRLANAALGQAMLIALGAGGLIGSAVFLVSPSVAELLALRGESLVLCVSYLRILACAAPMSAVLFVGAASLRAAGDTRTPFIVLVIVNIVNISLSVAMVTVWQLGVVGIAIGTVVGYAMGMLIILVVLIRGMGGIRLRLMRLRPRVEMLRRILAVALPGLAETSGMWIGNFFVVKVVGMLQSDAVMGAHGIAIRLEGISYLGGFAMGTAAATLAGQYLGAGNPEKARQAVNLCWLAAVCLMSTMGLLFAFAPEAITRLATDEPGLLAITPRLLFICAFVQPFFATYMALAQALRGAGDTRATMWLTYGSTFLVRLPGAYVLGIWMGWGIDGVWIALCAELVIRGFLFAGRYLQGGWMRVRV